jgi:hypothetical protein
MSPGDVNFIVKAITTNKGKANNKHVIENIKSIALLMRVMLG